MPSLATQYLGLKLANPLILGASPLGREPLLAQRVADAGIGAIVMHSLFEEDLLEDVTQRQLLGLPTDPDSQRALFRGSLDRYLKQLEKLKKSVGVPVIASLNGVSASGWMEQAKALVDAGADALELNVYYLAASPAESSTAVEARYIELVRQLRATLRIPFAVKLSSQFTALPHFLRRLEAEGASGFVLFNRFYQPDIDLNGVRLIHRPIRSRSEDVLMALHWIAMLRGRINGGLSASGGVQHADDVLKLLLAGADTVQIVGAVLNEGPGLVSDILAGVGEWLDAHGYDSVADLRGRFSENRISDPGAYERIHYRGVLDNWRAPGEAWR
ncbi:MAG TPA: dihydroorotate dehydrogenase-like protein [Plasticicumulans sp.]|nr:dihydroorotate dehydrogenase-like protein [Plasticicumulans sp.]HMW44209.1 dihydroorotate dehydrogenase-like protein [Plasticicumulans sp.]